MPDQLTMNEVALALSMVDAHRWRNGGSKVALTLVVALNTAGDPRARGRLVPIGRRHLADETGMDSRWVRTVLAELTDERVLTVTSEAAGSRGRCYVVTPDVAAWRVPWRIVSSELVEYRLAVFSGRLRPANGASVVRYAAPQTRIAARYDTQQPGPSGAPYRATNGNGHGDYAAPQTAGRHGPPPLSRESLSSSWEEEERRVEPSEAAELVAKVIRARTGGPLFGAPLERLRAAMADVPDHQAGELVAYVRHFPFRGGFLVLVEAAIARAAELGGDGPAPIEPSSRDDEARLAELLASDRQIERAPRPPDFFDRVRASLHDDVRD